jgi:hypothetical protein
MNLHKIVGIVSRFCFFRLFPRFAGVAGCGHVRELAGYFKRDRPYYVAYDEGAELSLQSKMHKYLVPSRCKMIPFSDLSRWALRAAIVEHIKETEVSFREYLEYLGAIGYLPKPLVDYVNVYERGYLSALSAWEEHPYPNSGTQSPSLWSSSSSLTS